MGFKESVAMNFSTQKPTQKDFDSETLLGEA